MDGPAELTDEEKRELLKESEKNPLLRIKSQWDSLNPKPELRFDKIKGDPAVTVGVRFSF